MEDKEFEGSQYFEMLAQLGGVFESIETVDFIPRIKEKGVFYIAGKAKIILDPVFPNGFMVTGISIKS